MLYIATCRQRYIHVCGRIHVSSIQKLHSRQSHSNTTPATAHLGIIVDDGVGQDIEAGRARQQERPPPPVVVLPTQLEVGHHYGNLRAGDDQDHKHEEEKAKQVVELVLPYGLCVCVCVCVREEG